ncbi:MAG: DUF2800 domain-containing protein [Firmicutes bacterium]|nr:DUF2800 domain-containing protein [Bacillota bacterium]
MKHALLSASGSARWLACPPSAKLEEQFPDAQSEYAAEGTFAHELAELLLSRAVANTTKPSVYKTKLLALQKHEFYSQEMQDYIQQYVDQVSEIFMAAKVRCCDTVALLEQRLDYSNWVPDGFGTGDVVIIADNTVEIIDLKYGKGVPVSAENNSQMRLYGLGAYAAYSILYDIQTVRMTIIQPRLDNISTEELSVDKLLAWATDYVAPKAKLAASGKGEFVAGDHCRFCKAKATCRARVKANLELAKHEFRKPPLLDVPEIAEILTQAEQLQKWASDIQAYALEQAEKHGVKFPGYKLVEGRSNRKYADEAAVATKLSAEGYTEDQIFQKKLLGITAMEKLLGKKEFGLQLGDLVIKPPGKPTLVPESDGRPELNSAEAAKADFG